ncbi:UNVERIFIED_CONTAM: hypothetical protein NCL1_57690 [Trichonephila clavipes]
MFLFPLKGLAEILKNSLKPFGRRVIGYDFTSGDPIGDKTLPNLMGEDWKRIRTIITPAFTSKRMRQASRS